MRCCQKSWSTRPPNCRCCQKWADYLSAASFPVEVIATPELAALKVKLGVPDDLNSCHTAEAAGYVLEGHVAAEVILRLLREKPAAIGLAFPGMPAGAPGMGGGAPATYEVILFGKDGRKTYARLKVRPNPHVTRRLMSSGGYCAPFF